MKKRNGCVLYCLMILTIAASSCGRNDEWKEASRSFYKSANVVINRNTLSILQSSTANLTVTRTPADLVTYTFTWSSSNNSVAAVDASGLVTGVSGGDCEIYATCDQTKERGVCRTHVLSADTQIQSISFTPDPDHTNTLEALDPVFTTATTEYLYAPVKYTYGTLSVHIQTIRPLSTITASLNGTEIGTGTGMLNLSINPLNVGENTFQATIDSEDGSNSSTYTTTIFRAVPIFKTGKFASTAPGDDGTLKKGVSWPTIRFTELSTNVIFDNMTGLRWDINSTTPVARSGIPTTILTASSGWRLPNIRELRSLINYGVTDSASWINTFVTADPLLPVQYWSAQDFGSNGFVLDFSTGQPGITGLSTTFTNRYITVSTSTYSNLLRTGGTSSLTSSEFDDYGIAWPWSFDRFIRHGNAITDRATGLVWYYESQGIATWGTALANSTALDGSTGWRVPNINEFESLIDYTNDPGAALNTHGFNVVSATHWTSTFSGGSQAYAVRLIAGDVVPVNTASLIYYLLVRGSSE